MGWSVLVPTLNESSVLLAMLAPRVILRVESTLKEQVTQVRDLIGRSSPVCPTMPRAHNALGLDLLQEIGVGVSLKVHGVRLAADTVMLQVAGVVVALLRLPLWTRLIHISI